jgi:hypothetical protein
MSENLVGVLSFFTSVMRLGREALVRRWLGWTVEQLLAQLLDPHPALHEQLELPT